MEEIIHLCDICKNFIQRGISDPKSGASYIEKDCVYKKLPDGCVWRDHKVVDCSHYKKVK